MADAEAPEPIVITRREPIPEEDLKTQILKAIKEDAHRQKSHREIDRYLSSSQSTYVLTQMLQALQKQPDDPFLEMGERLAVPESGETQTVIGSSAEEMMSRDPLLSSLDPRVFREVRNGLRTEKFEQNQAVFEAGQPATRLALVLSGDVRVGEKTLGRGHCLGQEALFKNTVYRATCAAAGPCEVAFVDGEQIQRLILENSVRREAGRGDVFQAAVRGQFPSLSRTEVDFVARLAEPAVFEPGRVIARKQQILQEIFVVTDVFSAQDAENAVQLMNSNQQKEIEQLPPGNADVKAGDVIGAEGVLLGKEETRDWIAGGVVSAYAVSADALRTRAELVSKMKRDVE